MAKWTRITRSRQSRGCWDCERLIPAGTRHLVSTATPGHEGITHPTRWQHARICEACCQRYGYERELWAQAEAA